MCTNIEKINKLDVPLYVDITCGVCKKRMALSNSHQSDGLYYCDKCYNSLPEAMEVKRLIDSSKVPHCL